MPSRHFVCSTESETAAAGREIARLLPPEATVHLIGDLGAGKTFLARAIATELGADPREVASPSFAIVHEYPVRPSPPAPLPAARGEGGRRPGEGHPIIHIDGYRLSENRREWLEIGIPEILAGPGVKLIEWPKRDFEEFEDAHVDVTIRVQDDGTREIDYQPTNL